MSGYTTEELIRLSQSGDRKATETLLNGNMGLIWSVARRFFGRGVDGDDLYQLGCLGFLKAIEGFDTAYGTQFSTYAVPKIAGEIRRFLRDDGTVKVSRGLKEQSVAIKATRSRLAAELNREPTINEISAEVGLTPEEIALAETATAATESIQRECGEDGFTLEDILADSGTEESMLERLALRQAIEKLPEREAMVIRLRYYHDLTQEKVAKILTVSQVQVSRIEKKAISHLRELM
ncbi:MAG: sigma-70 family RNA polymerase sigma factor [Ruminococcaceae bacterium]|nr:sigma-70 family RNA polymerase sigma factor [Oscillospiraceae bacterium]